jgi:class 3 adenylate cyclase/tetratricopeptide (TPR) repeat protein
MPLLLTIVFTDVVGSSATKRDTSLGRDARERDHTYLEKVQSPHFSLIRECSKARQGREVSTMGDAFYLAFDDPVEAVRCAVDIQRRLTSHPIETPRGPLRLRIGIHSGYPELFETSYHGTDVDKAARVEAMATAQQILLSSTTYELVAQMTDVKFNRKGEFALKGVDRVVLWEAAWDGARPRPTAVPPLDIQRRNKRRRVTAAVLALILLLVGAAGYRYYVTRQAEQMARALHGSVKGRRSVAVLGFKNLGHPEAAWLSTALAEELTTELAAGEQLRTIPGENVAQMKINLSLPDAESYAPETLTRVRSQLAADDLVLGSYLDLGTESGGRLRLDTCVQDTISRETICKVAETGTEANLFDLVSKTGNELRRYLGTSEVTPADAGAVRASTPPDPTAARLYSDGLKRLRVFDALGARDLLEKAVAVAPNYPMSHSALAETWSTLGYDAKATEEFKKAFDLSTNLSRPDRLWIEAEYRLDNKEPQKAIDIYRSLFEVFPDNIGYGLALANAETRHGKAKDSLAAVAALRRLAPPAGDDPRIDVAEAEATAVLADFHREQQAAETARTKAEAQENILFVARAQMQEAGAFQDLGELGKAIALYQSAKDTYTRAGDRGHEGAALLGLAKQLEMSGDYANAQHACEQSLAIRREIGNQRGVASSLNEMAVILRHEGALARARQILEEARQINHERGNLQAESQVIGNIGNILDDQGDIVSAKKAYEDSLAISQEIGDKLGQAISLENVANELTALGQTADAKKMYEESRRMSIELGSKYETTDVDLLYGDLLFQTGDIPAARQKYDEALPLAVQFGDQSYIAASHSGIGDLLAAAGDLSGAEKEYENAIAIFTKVGSKASVAETQIPLAKLRIEQGDAAKAFDLATQALHEFDIEKSGRREEGAHLVLGRALLALGHVVAAQKETHYANELSRENQDRRQELDSQITGAMLAARNPLNSAAAAKILAKSVVEAKRFGFVAYEFDARLVLGEIEMQSRNPSASAHLKQLQTDATAKGFTLVARKAASADKEDIR